MVKNQWVKPQANVNAWYLTSERCHARVYGSSGYAVVHDKRMNPLFRMLHKPRPGRPLPKDNPDACAAYLMRRVERWLGKRYPIKKTK